MPLKVTWKKGMRLSTDVFDALDTYIDENIMMSNRIATGGKCGLVSSEKTFELSVNVGNNILEIVSLSCHGVTSSGKIVDIDFDSNYSNTFDTRVTIPNSESDEAFILLVKYHDRKWREVNEMYSEPYYTFQLVGENTLLDHDSLPIGLLVNQYGWRLDETEFVPPCLYVDAHPKFMDQALRARRLLKSIFDQCLNAQNCVARHLLGSIWKAVADNYIHLDKSQEILSPAETFEAIQKVVASFVIGCSIDQYVSLDNADPFIAYCQRPYDARNLYRDIQHGLDLCEEIAIKMQAVCSMSEVIESPVAPVEKPVAKQMPPDIPQSKGRNRWAGIEI